MNSELDKLCSEFNERNKSEFNEKIKEKLELSRKKQGELETSLLSLRVIHSTIEPALRNFRDEVIKNGLNSRIDSIDRGLRHGISIYFSPKIEIHESRLSFVTTQTKKIKTELEVWSKNNKINTTTNEIQSIEFNKIDTAWIDEQLLNFVKLVLNNYAPTRACETHLADPLPESRFPAFAWLRKLTILKAWR